MTSEQTSERAGASSDEGMDGFDLSHLRTASDTDVGVVRQVNQDAYGEFSDPKRGYHLLFVADGMGGHRAGEVASKLAVEAVGQTFEQSTLAPSDLLQEALESANRRIFEASSEDTKLAGMGTTGVALLISSSTNSCIAHVGDSRAYRLRDGELSQITGDHSVVGELVRRGQLTSEEARVHPQSNEILRALGTQATVEVELTPIDMRTGDLFLLCSDGLSGMLRDDEIRDAVLRLEPAAATAELIEMANQAGGTDNITVQIALLSTSAASASGSEVVEPASTITDFDSPSPPAAAASEVTHEQTRASYLPWAVGAFLLIALLLILLFSAYSGG